MSVARKTGMPRIFSLKERIAAHGTSWRNDGFMIKTEHQEAAMKRYFSGEKIEIGDHITTDGGDGHNVILKIINHPAGRDDYGLDCFGSLMSSSQTGGGIISCLLMKFVHRIPGRFTGKRVMAI